MRPATSRTRPAQLSRAWAGWVRTVTLVAVAALCAWSLATPVGMLTQARAHTAARQAEQAHVQQQVWDAAAAVDALSSPEGVELRARAQLGYVHPGEVLVILPD